MSVSFCLYYVLNILDYKLTIEGISLGFKELNSLWYSQYSLLIMLKFTLPFLSYFVFMILRFNVGNFIVGLIYLFSSVLYLTIIIKWMVIIHGV